jgi:hypothetical protein
MKLATVFAFAGALVVAMPAFATERPDHYQPKPSPTLEAALANLTEFNPKLAALLEKDSLTPEELNQVHQLTYTLEAALEKLGSEQARVAELLEEVHVASEKNDSSTVKTSGRAYLEGTAPLTR